MIAGESRGTVSDSKVEGLVSDGKFPTTPYKGYSGVNLEEYMEITDYSYNTKSQ